jgi:hypothetical protein
MAQLLKTYFGYQVEANITEDLRNSYELFMYYYIEYLTPEASENRMVDLGDEMLDTFDKIIKNRLKAQKKIKMFAEGAIAHPHLLEDSF